MKNKGQMRLLNSIASPYGLAIFSYAIFLFSCLLPPSIYTHYMGEPDLMFLDPATILYYTLGVASFIAGLSLVGWIFPSNFADHEVETKLSPTVFLLTPLVLGIAITITSTLYLIKNNPIIMLSLLAQSGENIKDTMIYNSTGYFGLVPPMLTMITWWAFWRYSHLDLRGWRRWLIKLSIFVAVLSIIGACIVTVDRSEAMIALCGFAILFLMRSGSNKQRSAWFMIRRTLAIAIAIPVLFIAFSFLRGTSNLDGLVKTFIGYTIASYNRMAAMVNGNLHFPFAGRGISIGGAFVSSHLLPLRSYLELPDFVDLFGSSFRAVSQAGLDGGLVWEGAFADIVGDLGWFYLPFVFGYGILYGVVWNWFKRGKVLGGVLYPWFGFCILFWIGGNYLFGGPIEMLFPLAILFACYELAFVRRARQAIRDEDLQLL